MQGGRIIVKDYNNEMPCLNVNKGFTIRCKPLACSEKSNYTVNETISQLPLLTCDLKVSICAILPQTLITYSDETLPIGVIRQ